MWARLRPHVPALRASSGFEAAVAQHYLWGFMLLVIIFYGPGALSIDGLLARRSGYVTRDSY